MIETPWAQEAITQMPVPVDKVPLEDAPNDEVHLQGFPYQKYGHRKSME